MFLDTPGDDIDAPLNIAGGELEIIQRCIDAGRFHPAEPLLLAWHHEAGLAVRHERDRQLAGLADASVGDDSIAPVDPSRRRRDARIWRRAGQCTTSSEKPAIAPTRVARGFGAGRRH